MLRSTPAQPARSTFNGRSSTPFVERSAVGDPLVERIAHQDGKLCRTSCGSDPRRPAGSASGSRKCRRTGLCAVEGGAHELRQQVSVGCVEFDGVKAGLLHPPGRLGELVHQLENLGDGRLPDLLALLLGVLVDDLVPADHGSLRTRSLAPRVLYRGIAHWRPGCWSWTAALRAVAMHALGQARQPGHVVVAVGDQAGYRWPAGPGVGRGRHRR